MRSLAATIQALNLLLSLWILVAMVMDCPRVWDHTSVGHFQFYMWKKDSTTCISVFFHRSSWNSANQKELLFSYSGMNLKSWPLALTLNWFHSKIWIRGMGSYDSFHLYFLATSPTINQLLILTRIWGLHFPQISCNVFLLLMTWN